MGLSLGFGVPGLGLELGFRVRVARVRVRVVRVRFRVVRVKDQGFVSELGLGLGLR